MYQTGADNWCIESKAVNTKEVDFNKLRTDFHQVAVLADCYCQTTTLARRSSMSGGCVVTALRREITAKRSGCMLAPDDLPLNRAKGGSVDNCGSWVTMITDGRQT